MSSHATSDAPAASPQIGRASWKQVVVLALASLLCAHAGASARQRRSPALDLPCAEQAAAFHGINVQLLKAIIHVESRGNPTAIGKNSNGTIDVGLGQMNSIHFKELARYGIAPDHLLDGCINTYVTAWHLAKQLKAYGNTWAAVGSYHSRTPVHRDRYAGQIYEVLRRWQAVP